MRPCASELISSATQTEQVSVNRADRMVNAGVSKCQQNDVQKKNTTVPKTRTSKRIKPQPPAKTVFGYSTRVNQLDVLSVSNPAA